MDKIICLVGESGAGKSVMAELLEKEGYNYIESYTTRKPRYESERGHIFVESNSKEALTILMDNGEGGTGKLPFFKVHPYWLKKDVIAYTYFDNAHYWATKEQYKNKGTSIYIIDPAGIKDLKENVIDAEIVVIYLKVDEKERFYRMLTRLEESNCNAVEYKKRLNKINERLKHDKEAFKIIPCDYVVDANRSIEEVLKDVKGIIEV